GQRLGRRTAQPGGLPARGQRALAPVLRTVAGRRPGGRAARPAARRRRRAPECNLAVEAAVVHRIVHITFVRPVEAAYHPLLPWMPPEAPLEMPVQSLDAGRLARGRPSSSPATIGRRRALVFGTTAGLTLVAAYQLWWLLRAGGIALLEAIVLALFVPLF